MKRVMFIIYPLFLYILVVTEVPDKDHLSDRSLWHCEVKSKGGSVVEWWRAGDSCYQWLGKPTYLVLYVTTTFATFQSPWYCTLYWRYSNKAINNGAIIFHILNEICVQSFLVWLRICYRDVSNLNRYSQQKGFESAQIRMRIWIVVDWSINTEREALWCCYDSILMFEYAVPNCERPKFESESRSNTTITITINQTHLLRFVCI